jgi:hypothetical protein
LTKSYGLNYPNKNYEKVFIKKINTTGTSNIIKSKLLGTSSGVVHKI